MCINFHVSWKEKSQTSLLVLKENFAQTLLIACVPLISGRRRKHTNGKHLV